MAHKETDERASRIMMEAAHVIRLDHAKLADCGMALAAKDNGEIALYVMMGDEPILHERFEAFVGGELGADAVTDMREKSYRVFVGMVLSRILA